MYLTSEPLAALASIRHGFFTRKGGVSDGIFASLNIGYGSNDVAEKVSENRARVERAMQAPTGSLTTQYQVHGIAVTPLTAPVPYGESAQADAMVTDRPNILLGILTADCAPILFADPRQGVIGAAHAGWKGAFGGIAQETVKAMQALGAKTQNIVVSLGPCIAQKSYEVDMGFRDRFITQTENNSRFFLPSPRVGHFQFDLRGYIAHQLALAGVEQVNLLANDTCFEEDDFFSYRRTTLRLETQYGRQVSTIMLV